LSGSILFSENQFPVAGSRFSVCLKRGGQEC
jgi:hypothetical protein